MASKRGSEGAGGDDEGRKVPKRDTGRKIKSEEEKERERKERERGRQHVSGEDNTHLMISSWVLETCWTDGFAHSRIGTNSTWLVSTINILGRTWVP